MKFKIHRGTKEIGGSCVEVWTDNTTILMDFGRPLVGKGGGDFILPKGKSIPELVEAGVLPKIENLYEGSEKLLDGIIISHPHQDHYGLINFISKDAEFHLGEATHKIIEISNIFTPQNIILGKTKYFSREKPFQIGDFKITPYWNDHSAFDSYSFLIEADGKSIFYSGDFRGHGRKKKVFKWFTHHAPQDVDYLILEGTSIGRDQKPFKTEEEIEKDMKELFSQPEKINLILTSGQNIDRLISIYKAAKSLNKILVIDPYIANTLKVLSKFSKLPNPSKKQENLKVLFTRVISETLGEDENVKILYQFKHNKISKEFIDQNKEKIIMVIRGTMKTDLERLKNIDGGNLIYSLWDGYLKKHSTKKITDYLDSRNFTLTQIHTSGHADTQTLKALVGAIKPKNIVPIHTFKATEFKKIFTTPVVELDDGETQTI